MNRRKFLQKASLLSFSLLFPGLQGWALSGGSKIPGSKKLLVIFLRGAVDGLNVVIPYADSRYFELRPSIAIAAPGVQGGALDLDGRFALNPALAPLLPAWKDRSMAFVHCCGSPDPSRSHFDAQDYMETGTPGSKMASTGWMNRLLEVLPDNHSALQAVNFGPTQARILEGPRSVASVQVGPGGVNKMPVDMPVIARSFEQLYSSGNDSMSRAFAEGMEARRKIMGEMDQEMVKASRGAPLPGSARNFGKQISRLFSRDQTIQLAFLALGGFDTHVNQGSSTGQLANHLTAVGEGLAEFIAGLGPVYKDTAIVVLSEFGRTVRENGNGGTDHGHGNVMWLFGGAVQGGKIFGHFPGLSDGDLFEGRDLPVTTDFRAVLSEVLVSHFEVTDSGLNKIFPGFKNSRLGALSVMKS